MKKLTTRSMVLCLMLIFASVFVHADVYIKQKRYTQAMKIMGKEQPAEEVVEEIWITPQGFRSDNPTNSVVMVFDQKKIVMIDHVKKTYMEMPLDVIEGVTEQMGKDEDAEAFQAMMEGMMKMEVSVQEQNERRQVNGWKCQKYLLTIKTMMGPMNQEIWATQELNVDQKLYNRFSTAIMAANPMLKSLVGDMMREMEKIKGVQVRNVFSQKIMNQTVTSTTDLLEYKNTTAPKGILDIPSGYKKKKWKQ